jgi:hypothetical protein
MITKGSRVRHIHPAIDQLKGIMTVFAVKNGVAICGYAEYARLHVQPQDYPVAELRLSE